MEVLVRVAQVVGITTGLYLWYKHRGPFGPVSFPPASPLKTWEEYALFYGIPLFLRVVILWFITELVVRFLFWLILLF